MELRALVQSTSHRPKLAPCQHALDRTKGSWHSYEPGETIRYFCEECLVVFDLGLLPAAAWPEIQEERDDGTIDAFVSCCPYCMSSVIEPLHDWAVTTSPSA